MLFFIALFAVPALAAFFFQLICFMNYKKSSSHSHSPQWGDHQALHNF